MTTTGGRRSAQRRPGFVGRAAEWVAATAELDVVATGRPSRLAVLGEPGIGKSRLLAELAAEADARGHLVLTGRGAEFERDIPFGVWVDALDDYLGALGTAGVQRLIGDQHVELRTVFPALGPLRAGAPAP